jgi:chromosome segregation ATPase
LVDLDSERLAVIKEKDVARQERVARLQRDYRITMFQAKESELDGIIEELADEIQDMKEKGEENTNTLVMQYQEAADKLRIKCSQLAAEVTQKARELTAVQKEKDKVEVRVTLSLSCITITYVYSQTNFSRLREEHAEITAASASAASKLERVTLQRDGAQTEIADLERLNDEFKRNNAELKRQMDKWQNLETKGGVEVETLRKRRIELEVQVKEFEGRLADADKTEQERNKALEKERKKVEKLKGAIDSWRVREPTGVCSHPN